MAHTKATLCLEDVHFQRRAAIKACSESMSVFLPM
jgi:hypothetical protein